ncbi:TerC/Alx family metal homeostasis membrane protein [Aureisphaera sp. CAU 1614]|uniref:TerC/Alx family metal homeostasis membrane protein n=1 Tax=Halomarinibacterium sedimenti TaxID=2857106 RepID=A0A9X1JVR6_9FLAO|nr:TerC/Alx family metal homeostasis membrane protein [Halomarinibacterium sedimenti]MBW2938045.1 TerC/Alx family metal homeostasis membrane protein [Halomarinibacterium sedimenti]
MTEHYVPWVVLIAYVLFLLLLDFFVLHKKGTTPTSKKALYETLFFVANALLFSGVVFWFFKQGLVDNPNNYTPTKAWLSYLTGYIIELSLSVDNLFVIAVIFTSFKIPSKYQHRLLFLGILGALIFRAILISVGIVLINKFHQMSIIFGLFLLFTAFKMLKKEAEHEDPKQPKGLSKVFRFTKIIDGDKFVTQIDGKRVFTALFGALVTIEFTDLLFALDSIPAIFAVTTDPFIVFSSNIFAIMGLRSLYFFLANMLEKFKYLKYSVFAILIFVSIKLMSATLVEIPEWFSLTFIVLSLAGGVYVSLLNAKKED